MMLSEQSMSMAAGYRRKQLINAKIAKREEQKRWWEISHLTLVHHPVNVYLPHLRGMMWYLQAICRERPGCIW